MMLLEVVVLSVGTSLPVFTSLPAITSVFSRVDARRIRAQDISGSVLHFCFFLGLMRDVSRLWVYPGVLYAPALVHPCFLQRRCGISGQYVNRINPNTELHAANSAPPMHGLQPGEFARRTGRTSRQNRVGQATLRDGTESKIR